MAILNYTTAINCERSIGEIQKCLVAHGAHKIVTDYISGVPSSVTFCLTFNGNLVAFSLPANFSGVLRAMQNDKKVPRSKCTEEQAQKIAWRIIKDWVEAQCAIIDAQLADVAEVFLPYAITQNGNTLYKEFQGGKLLMLQQ